MPLAEAPWAVDEEEPHPVQIGKCFLRGLGVPQDTQEATLWFDVAAAEGNKEAKQLLDNLGPPPTDSR